MIKPRALTPTLYFQRRSLTRNLILISLVLLVYTAMRHTDFRIQTVFTAIPRVVSWVASNLVPDEAALRRLPNIIAKLLDTVMISVMATVTSALLSLIFALMGSRSTMVHPLASVLAKVVASISRNIPVAAWAMIFLITFGMSSFTGYLALFFATFGFLTRAFIETIDEASAGQVEALRATGASYPHVVVQAVLPSSLPQMLSWILYMVETNVRDATLVGLLTGSGIGFLFDLYYKSMQYKSASLLVFLLVVVVLLIETISNTVRRQIL